MLLFGWIGDNGDPDNFLNVHFNSANKNPACCNVANYANPEVDKLLTDAQIESIPEKRAALYVEAQKKIAADAPWVPISHAVDFVAARKDVTGFTLYPTGSIFLKDVDKSAGEDGKKVLVYARGADATALDPAYIEDGESAKVITNVYDTLVGFKPGTTEIVPALATEWTISADGTEYTFKLRQGVKFHDGTPFNADAVVFSHGRQLADKATEDMPYAGFTFDGVKSVEKVDDYTVRYTLARPNSPFLLNLAMGLAAPIVSPKAKNPKQQPVGTGPFIFEKWDADQQIVLRANPNYWGGAPKVDRVIFKVTKDNIVRQQELQSGAVDIIDGVDPASIEALQGDANVNLMSQPGMNINYLAFRTDRPPFDNPDLRKAISMAINVPEIVRALYGDIAVPATSFMPEGLLGYASDVGVYGYNPEEAKKILDRLGYATTK